MNIACNWCKKEFERTQKHKKYCSKECAAKAKAYHRNKRQRKWRKKHKEYYNEYLRIYMQKYRKEHGYKERLFLKAGTIYLRKTKDWNEELELLEKYLKPIRNNKAYL